MSILCHLLNCLTLIMSIHGNHNSRAGGACMEVASVHHDKSAKDDHPMLPLLLCTITLVVDGRIENVGCTHAPTNEDESE